MGLGQKGPARSLVSGIYSRPRLAGRIRVWNLQARGRPGWPLACLDLAGLQGTVALGFRGTGPYRVGRAGMAGDRLAIH